MRDTKLLEKRDQKVLDRYLYWTEERRVRFDDAIKILAEDEFFLSEFTIMDIIRDMIREGRSGSDGKQPTRMKFIGFRVKPSKPKSSPSVCSPSLFDKELTREP